MKAYLKFLGKSVAMLAAMFLVAVITISSFHAREQTMRLDRQLAELQSTISGLSLMLESSVRILVTGKGEKSWGVGSGVVVAIDNSRLGAVYVVTNHHVANYFLRNREKAKEEGAMVVEFFGGEKSAKVAIVALQPERDLALLRVELPVKETITETIKVAAICEENSRKLWQEVYAVGGPLNLPIFPTRGLVSLPYLVRMETAEDAPPEAKPYEQVYILHSSPIAPGNSGGGLFTFTPVDGACLLGINTAVATQQALGVFPMAVPVNHVALAIPGLELYNWLLTQKADKLKTLSIPPKKRG